MILSKFGTNLTIRSTASTDVHMNKLPGRADLEAKLSSGDQLCLSLYSHTILTTGSPTVLLYTEEWPNRCQI